MDFWQKILILAPLVFSLYVPNEFHVGWAARLVVWVNLLVNKNVYTGQSKVTKQIRRYSVTAEYVQNKYVLSSVCHAKLGEYIPQM